MMYSISLLMCSNNSIGAFNSAYYAACAVGNFLNWYLPDKYGRLRTIQMACVNSVIAIILQTAAQNFGMFVAGRVLGGLSCGLVFAICPTYAAVSQTTGLWLEAWAMLICALCSRKFHHLKLEAASACYMHSTFPSRTASPNGSVWGSILFQDKLAGEYSSASKSFQLL